MVRIYVDQSVKVFMGCRSIICYQMTSATPDNLDVWNCNIFFINQGVVHFPGSILLKTRSLSRIDLPRWQAYPPPLLRKHCTPVIVPTLTLNFTRNDFFATSARTLLDAVLSETTGLDRASRNPYKIRVLTMWHSMVVIATVIGNRDWFS